ncbi:hypothetical protein Landi51_00110 [Colletotrichum acutatum]
MASKRPPSASFIENPFIKKRNQEWSLDVPGLKTDYGKVGEKSGEDEELEVRDTTVDDGLSRGVVVMPDSPPREPEHDPEIEPKIKPETTTSLSAAALLRPPGTTYPPSLPCPYAAPLRRRRPALPLPLARRLKAGRALCGAPARPPDRGRAL